MPPGSALQTAVGVQVGVKEAEGSLAEHPVNVAGQRYVLTEVGIKSKVGKGRGRGRRRRKGQAEGEDEDEEEGEEAPDDPGGSRCHPSASCWVTLAPRCVMMSHAVTLLRHDESRCHPSLHRDE